MKLGAATGLLFESSNTLQEDRIKAKIIKMLESYRNDHKPGCPSLGRDEVVWLFLYLILKLSKDRMNGKKDSKKYYRQ